MISLLLVLLSQQPQPGCINTDAFDEPGAPRLGTCVESEEPTAATSTTAREDTRSFADRIEELELKVEELEAARAEEERRTLSRQSSVRFHGFIDFGFFATTGDGSGVVQDVGNKAIPRYGERWVFLGDLLSTAVNSRGEAAYLGDLPGVERYDGIHSQGAPGFILNELNFHLTATLGEDLSAEASVSAVPRTGKDFSIGDFIDVDLAQLRWAPIRGQSIFLFLGKIDSSFGVEYKSRKADTRFGITPSLVARYTTGTPLGAKVRAHLFEDLLVLTASFTNGSSGTEQFHFYDETDSNTGKTFTGRAAVRIPLAKISSFFSSNLDIGFSGQVGAQDRVRDSADMAWMIGADLEYLGSDVVVQAQWIKGLVPGRPEDNAYALDLKSGFYLEIDYMFLSTLGVLVRGELRDALIRLDGERVYKTQGWRAVAGLRWTIVPEVIAKLELIHNGEYGEVPEFANDVATSSLVVTY